jgi:hypothetical protein
MLIVVAELWFAGGWQSNLSNFAAGFIVNFAGTFGGDCQRQLPNLSCETNCPTVIVTVFATIYKVVTCYPHFLHL